MEEKEIKKLLLKENEGFRKAFEQHQRYEKELEKFKEKGFLKEEEKLKEKKLKKKKLVLKDIMYYIMTEYKKSIK